jgi:hypothetical protein
MKKRLLKGLQTFLALSQQERDALIAEHRKRAAEGKADKPAAPTFAGYWVDPRATLDLRDRRSRSGQ